MNNTITPKPFDRNNHSKHDNNGKLICKDFLKFKSYDYFEENDEESGKPKDGYYDLLARKGDKEIRVGAEIKTTGWGEHHIRTKGIPFGYPGLTVLPRTLKENSDYHIFASPKGDHIFAVHYPTFKENLSYRLVGHRIADLASLHPTLRVEYKNNTMTGKEQFIVIDLSDRVSYKKFGRFYSKNSSGEWIEN
jgi:hypothetical protein